MPHDLFPLLHNRMNREGQVVPQFMGEFHGVAALPRQYYPAIYFWVDTSTGGAIRLSFNNPLLEQWCREEASIVGAYADSQSIGQAIATLQKVATPAFESMIAATT